VSRTERGLVDRPGVNSNQRNQNDNRPTHRSCSWSRQGVDKHLAIKWHLYQNKGQIIQDLGVCDTVVQLGHPDIEGGPNSEAVGFWDDGFAPYQEHDVKRPAQKCWCSEKAWCHFWRRGERGTAQKTLGLWSRGTYVAGTCAQTLTLLQRVQDHDGGYKTMRATKEEMAGRFAQGFQDCWHHQTRGGVHGEGPTIMESHCLLSAGARWPVSCVVVTNALSQS